MQLDLLAYRSQRPKVAAVSATDLLWRAAGMPHTADATRVDGARCWWCGAVCPEGGWSRPRACLPDTFPFPLEAAVPDSHWLCLPCGWTLSETVALPLEIATPRIEARARKGGRLVVSVRAQRARRWLVLLLDDGRVGLWEPQINTVAEEPWTEAIPALRAKPGDVGPVRLVETVALADLTPEATEKFRSYHHGATQTPARWWPCTDADRAAIRVWLLDPPAPPWVMVVGDGKKHAAILAQLYDAVTVDNAFCVMLFRGAVVSYVPAELAAQVAAIEALLREGARDEEIETGRYNPRTLGLRLALRTHEPTVAQIRGGPAMGLALYLRRNRTELEAS